MTDKIRYLDSTHGTRIAYRQTKGTSPGVMFFGGFMSDMEGGKAIALEQWCEENGHAFLRFDYMGHGASSGAFKDGTIGLWRQDALAVFDALTTGPQILVGSSMGGWMAMLVAKARAERIAGFVGIAAAPDFTKRLWDSLSEDDQLTIRRDGKLLIASEYGPDPYIFTEELFRDGAQYPILGRPFSHDYPVKLIQGSADPDVPWQVALDIADTLEGDDIEVILVKDGDHRLSTPLDLKRLINAVSLLVGD